MSKTPIKLRDISDFYLQTIYFETPEQKEKEEKREREKEENMIISGNWDSESEHQSIIDLKRFLGSADRQPATEEMKTQFLINLNRIGRKSRPKKEEKEQTGPSGETRIYINVMTEEVQRIMDTRRGLISEIRTKGRKPGIQAVGKKKAKSRFNEDNDMQFEDLQLSIFSDLSLGSSVVSSKNSSALTESNVSLSSLRSSGKSESSLVSESGKRVSQIKRGRVQEIDARRVDMSKKGVEAVEVVSGENEGSIKDSVKRDSQSKNARINEETNNENETEGNIDNVPIKGDKKVSIDLRKNQMFGGDSHYKSSVVKKGRSQAKVKIQNAVKLDLNLNLKEKISSGSGKTMHIDSMNKRFMRRDTVDEVFTEDSDVFHVVRDTTPIEEEVEVESQYCANESWNDLVQNEGQEQARVGDIESAENIEQGDPVKLDDDPNQTESDISEKLKSSQASKKESANSSILNSKLDSKRSQNNSTIPSIQNEESQNSESKRFLKKSESESQSQSERNSNLSRSRLKNSEQKEESERKTYITGEQLSDSDRTETPPVTHYNSQIQLPQDLEMKWDEPGMQEFGEEIPSQPRRSKSMSHLKLLENTPLVLDWEDERIDEEREEHLESEEMFVKIEGGLEQISDLKREEEMRETIPMCEIEREILGNMTPSGAGSNINENFDMRKAAKRRNTFDDLRLSNTMDEEQNFDIDKYADPRKDTLQELRLSSSANHDPSLINIRDLEPQEFEFSGFGKNESHISEAGLSSNNSNSIETSNKKGQKRKKVIGTKKILDKIEFMIGEQKFGLETREIVESPLLSIEFMIGDQKIKLGEKSWSVISQKYQDIRPKIEEFKRMETIDSLSMLRELEEIINGVDDLGRGEVHEKKEEEEQSKDQVITETDFLAELMENKYEYPETIEVKESAESEHFIDIYSDIKKVSIGERFKSNKIQETKAREDSIEAIKDDSKEAIKEDFQEAILVEKIARVEDNRWNSRDTKKGIRKKELVFEFDPFEGSKEESKEKAKLSRRNHRGKNKKNTRENIIFRIKGRSGSGSHKKRDVEVKKTHKEVCF